MPGCVLRAGSETFDVDAFLAASSWEPSAVFRRGESGLLNRTTIRSGFNLVVSDRDGIAQQIPDVLLFLAEHEPEIRRLVQAVGPENVVLDFGTGFRDTPAHSELLSAELVRAAASAKIALGISIYLMNDLGDPRG
jgi:hypothetical protein